MKKYSKWLYKRINTYDDDVQKGLDNEIETFNYRRTKFYKKYGHLNKKIIGTTINNCFYYNVNSEEMDITCIDNSYSVPDSKFISWRGLVLDVLATSFIAQLSDSCYPDKTFKVEIQFEFQGQDLRSFKKYTKFVLEEQISPQKENHYSIRMIPSFRLEESEVQKKVDAKMKRFAYMFSDDD